MYVCACVCVISYTPTIYVDICYEKGKCDFTYSGPVTLHMASATLANIGSGNGLVPYSAKTHEGIYSVTSCSKTNVDLSLMEFYGIHLTKIL